MYEEMKDSLLDMVDNVIAGIRNHTIDDEELINQLEDIERGIYDF